MTRKLLFLAALTSTLAVPVFAQAQDYRSQSDRPGVILSDRERQAAYPVRLPDGRVVERAGSDGIPWLFGIGSVYGKASSLPLENGSTSSILRSTPSNGIVPGQEPR